MRLYVSLLLLAFAIAFATPSPAVAQLTDVDCLALFDADGTRIARSITTNSTNVFFSKTHNGFPVLIQAETDSLNSLGGTLYFTDANCSSTPFVYNPDDMLPTVLIGQDVYYSDPTAVDQNIRALSYLSESDGSCYQTDEFRDAAPVIGQFTLPQYTPPFHLEPEACYTPDPSVAALTPYGLGAMAFVFAFGAYLMRRRGAGLGR
jgi:hypothetical protein